jgi:sarcosine oxidase delta subunit
MATVKCPFCGYVQTLRDKTVFRLKTRHESRVHCTQCKRWFKAVVESDNPVPPAVLAALNIGLETWRRLPEKKKEQIRKLVEKGSIALAKHILRTSLLKSKP